jgi:hypothetical protein
MWYIISLFLRSKTYIESVCPDYVDTNMSRFMLACMELPMLTYLITSFLSIYDKSAFHLMLSMGMFVCVFVVWIMDFIFPQLGSDGAPCVYDNRGYACEECAVVWFVFVFMSCHLLLMHKRRGSIWNVINYMCLLGAYAFMAVFAQVYIGLFSFCDWELHRYRRWHCVCIVRVCVSHSSFQRAFCSMAFIKMWCIYVSLSRSIQLQVHAYCNKQLGVYTALLLKRVITNESHSK